MKLVFLNESGIAFQLGAAPAMAQAVTRGATVHDWLQVTSDGTRAAVRPRANNSAPCRDDLKCPAGSAAAKGV